MATVTEPARLKWWSRIPWSWQGAVAFTLSATIIVGMTILCLGVAFRVQGSPIPEGLAALLTAVISAKVGILGTFLGRFGSGTSTNAKSPNEKVAAAKKADSAAQA